jgi:hypothetical protein
MMMDMKWTRVTLVPVFVLSTFLHSALSLAHPFGSSTHSHLASHTRPLSPEVGTPSSSDHHPDSCVICRILASVQPGDVQAVSVPGDRVPTVDIAPVVFPFVVARGFEIISASPRAPPFLLRSVQG